MEGSNDISREISVETTRFNCARWRGGRVGRHDGGARDGHPAHPAGQVDPENKTTERLDQNIRDLAFGRGRKLTDNFEVFWEIPNRFNTHYLIEPADFVGHPNAQGYDVMARAFFETLRDIDHVPPVTASSIPSTASAACRRSRRCRSTSSISAPGVDPAATSLVVNGSPVPATLSGEGQRCISSTRRPRRGAASYTSRLRSRDRATPANSVVREIAAFYPVGITFLGGDVDRDGRVDGNDWSSSAAPSAPTSADALHRSRRLQHRRDDRRRRSRGAGRELRPLDLRRARRRPNPALRIAVLAHSFPRFGRRHPRPVSSSVCRKSWLAGPRGLGLGSLRPELRGRPGDAAPHPLVSLHRAGQRPRARLFAHAAA
jgi:hypothetical protein